MAKHIYDTLVSYDRYTIACLELKLCKLFVQICSQIILFKK